MFAPLRRLLSVRAIARVALAWLAVLGYLATVSGVPLPAPAAAKSGGAFPCQHGRCGCASAGQCWSSCCCHTPRERLAWAERHGVVPPVDLEALARLADAKLAAKPSSDCCAADSGAPASRASCHAEPSSETWSIVAIEALRCRGASTVWVTSGAVTAPPPLFQLRVEVLPVDRLAAFDLCSSSPAYVPDDPPPRRV